MITCKLLFFLTLLCFGSHGALSQHTEYKRCRCICPSPDAVLGNDKNAKPQMFVDSVPPDQCNCMGVVLKKVHVETHEQLYCLRCDCKYESRSPTLIKFVVIMFVVLLSSLVGYMLFLAWLRPLAQRKPRFYIEDGTVEAQSLMGDDSEG